MKLKDDPIKRLAQDSFINELRAGRKRKDESATSLIDEVNIQQRWPVPTMMILNNQERSVSNTGGLHLQPAVFFALRRA